jgi:hypothetical protein
MLKIIKVFHHVFIISGLIEKVCEMFLIEKVELEFYETDEKIPKNDILHSTLIRKVNFSSLKLS